MNLILEVVSVLQTAYDLAEAHPDLTRALIAEANKVLRVHGGGSVEAQAGMLEALSAMRASVATTAMMRERARAAKPSN